MNYLEKQCANLCREQYDKEVDVTICEDVCDVPIIVIQGTQSFRNWCRNVDILKTEEGIHRGFYKYACWCVKEYNLERVFSERDEIIITGHSLGAAAATIIPYILQQYNTKVYLVLFGSPKVGTKKFLNTLINLSNVTGISFRNEGDLVPYILSYLYVDIIPLSTINVKINKNNGISCIRRHSTKVYSV